VGIADESWPFLPASRILHRVSLRYFDMSFTSLVPPSTPAILALADGSVFSGVSVGASGETVGEVVFNTGMTGYQEILTDPSYRRQIVTFTYPHIGNTGINPEDGESPRIQVAGIILRELSLIVSNWRATESLTDFLKRDNIVAIAGIDTRQLTRILREKGAQSGCIVTGKTSADEAIVKARSFAGLHNKDLAIEVTTSAIIKRLEKNKLHLVVYDFGVKENILRLLEARGCRLTIVPATTSAEAVLKLKPDGVVLSNGPGDPAACDYAIRNIQQLMEKNIPLFGICLGFQLIALAFGAKTLKMKFGHHGINHPVQDVRSKKIFITSQNHSFCVDEKTLPPELMITHVSLFDHTLQGFLHKTKKIMAFQGHPEAGPGPHDITSLFDEFLTYAKTR